MMQRSTSPIVALALVLTAGLATTVHAQQVNARWLTATSANWSTAARWSTNPDIPNNNVPAGRTYRVVFDAAGVTYTANVSTAITIDELVMNSAPGRVVLSPGADFSVLGNITLTSGSLLLQGGRLRGGTVVAAGGTFNVDFADGSSIDAVTFSGAHNIAGPFARARVVNDLRFTSGSSLRLSGVSAAFNFVGSQSITGGALVLDHLNAAATIEGASVLTIASDAAVRGQGTLGSQLVTTNTHSLINQGEIAAAVSGGTLTVRPANFTNAGTARADAGATLAISATNWTNTGTISASGGTVNLTGNWSSPGTLSATSGELNLGGTFSTASLANLQTANATVRLTGVADNTGRTIAVNSPAWAMSGARIVGGTVDFTNAPTMALSGTSTLENARLTGAGRLQATAGATLAAAGPMSIDGQFTARTGGALLTLSGPATIEPGASLAGDLNSRVNTTGASFTNRGTLSVSGPQSELWLRSSSVTNQGELVVSDGGLLRIGELGVTSFSGGGAVRAQSGGRVVLESNLTTAGLGTISAPENTTYLRGRVDNTGSTLVLDATTGSWKAAGGRIAGGVVECRDGASLLFNDASLQLNTVALYLDDNVQLHADLVLGPVTGRTNWLNLENGLTLDGSISVTQPNATIHTSTDGLFSGGTYNFDAPSGNNSFSIDSGADVVFSPSTVVRGGSTGIVDTGTADSSLTFHGRASADIFGTPLYLFARDLVVDGVLEAVNGGILNVGGASPEGGLVNGTVRVRDSGKVVFSNRVRFGPDLAWDRSEGFLELAGTLVNTNSTFTLNAATQNLALGSGAVIEGGTVALRDGSLFYGSGLLRGVTIDGYLPVLTASTLTIENGLGLNGELHLAAASSNSTTLRFLGANQVSGDGDLVFDGGASTTQRLSVNATGSLTLGPGITVRGGGGTDRATVGGTDNSFGDRTTLINQGTISADLAGTIIGVWATTIVNQGVLEARNGGILRMRADPSLASWSNSGLIRALPGSSVTLANYVRTADLGDIREEGGNILASGLKIANDDSTLAFNSSTGSWQFSDSVIKGGVIRCFDGQILEANGLILTGLLLRGEVVTTGISGVTIAGAVDVQGTIRLAAPGSALRFYENGRLNSGTVLFEGTGTERSISGPGVAASLTLAPGVTVRGGNGAVRSGSDLSVLNQGRISADVDQQRIRIFTQRFTNEGTIEAINGGIIEFVPPTGLDPFFSFFNAGVLRALPGAPFSIPGDLTQGYDATLFVGFSEAGRGVLAVDGLLSLDGTLAVGFEDGFRPELWSEFHLFQAGEVAGRFRELRVRPLAYGKSWDLSTAATDGVLRVVPSAGTAMTLASGCLLFPRRRRTDAPRGGVS